MQKFMIISVFISISPNHSFGTPPHPPTLAKRSRCEINKIRAAPLIFWCNRSMGGCLRLQSGNIHSHQPIGASCVARQPPFGSVRRARAPKIWGAWGPNLIAFSLAR